MDKKDIGKSFEKLVDDTFINVDGILVQRAVHPYTGLEGYLWDDHWCASTEEVRAAKEYAANAIKMSIVNPNGDETILSKRYTEKYKHGESGYVEWKRDQIKKTEQDD